MTRFNRNLVLMTLVIGTRTIVDLLCWRYQDLAKTLEESALISLFQSKINVVFLGGIQLETTKLEQCM